MPPTIAFCTTCGNRLQHLRKTLPSNLRENEDYAALRFVLLDYGSRDGMAEFVKTNHQADIDSGRVSYWRMEAPFFRMSHAKNVAHRLGLLAGADILVNIDADNFTGPGFAKYVAEKFAKASESEDAIFLRPRQNHVGPGRRVNERQPVGSAGRIAISRAAFYQAGGYDEVFDGWNPDDLDLAARLERLGYARHGIPRFYLRPIQHDDKVRFANYPPGGPTNMVEAAQAFELDGRDDLTIANWGNVGVAEVWKNGTERLELKPIATRVFGIGMNKTATSSLSTALHRLGFDVAHWESPHWARRIYRELRWEGRSRTLEGYYCLGDMPFDLLFREVDRAYPGSKFILTIRDEASWLRSIEQHFRRFTDGWRPDGFTFEIHQAIWGRTDFDRETFIRRFRQHNAAVVNHFRNRPDDLLVMDMSAGAGWAELCRFLDRPVPSAPYPVEFVSPREEPPVEPTTPGYPERTPYEIRTFSVAADPARCVLDNR